MRGVVTGGKGVVGAGGALWGRGLEFLGACGGGGVRRSLQDAQVGGCLAGRGLWGEGVLSVAGVLSFLAPAGGGGAEEELEDVQVCVGVWGVVRVCWTRTGRLCNGGGRGGQWLGGQGARRA